MDTPTPDEILAALDDDQRVVATTIGPPVVVIAGAGTGKTRAITHRIAWASATGVQDPTRVLAVTFTTRAAGELRSRLHDLGVGGVQARTFHSAALRQAQHFWPGAYGTQLPEVTEKRFSLVADAAGRHRLKVDTGLLRDLSGEISWAKVSNVTPGEYPGLARAAARQLASTDPETVARVFTTYEQVKADRGLIDFDDILLCTAALLGENPDVAATVRSRYRHFVVDEYQDVSPLQQTLLDLWAGEGQDVCVVGDPRQSIHAFAGARPTYLTRFSSTHPGAQVVNLVRDYRSSPQVVGLANQVMATGPGRRGFPAPPLVAQGRPGPDPVLAPASDESGEARATAHWLKILNESGTAWNEMAVLFRINAQSPSFEAALADLAIPYQVRGTERFYERPEIRQALLTLRGAASAAPDDPGLRGVRDALAGLGWSESVPEGGGASRERWESWNALADLASDVVEQAPDATLADVVESLMARADRQHAPAGLGVTLATMHSAKGLEWDAVA
ncbi:MAG TPA: ATP-dependent helicase, partial [Propionibacteriaceae bacterium]|nr:ATP-dependent helicase [Propionibacteriaceae bacterium]